MIKAEWVICKTSFVTGLDQINSGRLRTWQHGEKETMMICQSKTGRVVGLPNFRMMVGWLKNCAKW